MKVFRDLEHLNAEVTGDIAVTMGNFDGVHLGHQDLINQIRKRSNSSKLLVITFRPHPIFVLRPDKDIHLIQTYDDKLKQLDKKGVDYILELNFDDSLRVLSGEEFLNQIILQIKNIQCFFMGFDFSIGDKETGTKDFVKEKLQEHSIPCYECEPFMISGKRISSSLIRDVILSGDVKAAESYLGRNWIISGDVVHGKKVGRGLGFPTANLRLDEQLYLPKLGVYVVDVNYNDKKYRGVLNIGKNPTIDSDEKIKVECHILEFNEVIYDQNIEVLFLARIRDEQKFENRDELIKKINEDIEYSRTYKC
jgi:riboflavin kinase/FMN adenylyltransferase